MVTEQMIPEELQINLTQAVEEKTDSVDDVDKYVTDYSDVRITETEYLYFPWFIRGKLNSVQGDTSTGKSTFLYGVGAYISNGWNLCGVPCEVPGNVMFITLEDSESDILTAFLDSGGDFKKLKKLRKDLIARIQLKDTKTLDFIEKAIIKKKLVFLVLDPIQNFLSGDINSASNTRPQLARLMNIAEKTGCCIAFIQHTGKDQTKSTLHKGLGSVDIGAATRSMIQIVSDPDSPDEKIAFTIKNNTASPSDVYQGLRYTIKDHPGSYDPKTGKHHHFHGHAEFIELIPFYDERKYKRALKKAQEREERDLQSRIEYNTDPLVITVRKLVEENPDGLFIGYHTLIRLITDINGTCPYTTTKEKTTGFNPRINFLRPLMIEKDSVQIDPSENALTLKPFLWNGKIFSDFKSEKERGITITPVKK